MKIEFPNPVHCCVCTALGHRDARAATIVAGYSVCLDHITIDEAASLRAYVELRRKAFGS